MSIVSQDVPQKSAIMPRARWVAYVKRGHTLFKMGTIRPYHLPAVAQALTYRANARTARNVLCRYAPGCARASASEVWFIHRESGYAVMWRFYGPDKRSRQVLIPQAGLGGNENV